VAWWVAEGWLHATRRPVRYGKHRVWRIERADLEDFLREYRWLYDPARIVDGGWARFVAGLPSATWVGTAEAARLLPYTPGSIAQLCRKGDLAGEHWGSAWRIPVAAIRAFVPPQIGHQGRGPVADELARRRDATKAARKTTGWERKKTAALAAD
jgi:hypothetical protein